MRKQVIVFQQVKLRGNNQEFSGNFLRPIERVETLGTLSPIFFSNTISKQISSNAISRQFL